MKYMIIWNEKDNRANLGYSVHYNTYTDREKALTAYKNLVTRRNRDEHDSINAVYFTEVLEEATE